MIESLLNLALDDPMRKELSSYIESSASASYIAEVLNDFDVYKMVVHFG